MLTALVVLLLAAGLLPHVTYAQDATPAKAGLVVDFGDGTVTTACVDLGPDGQATGEEVLRASGLAVLIEYSPMGGAVCSINGRGCNYPAQPCWCECMSSPCVYWAYYHLVDGQWVYSTRGASNYVVRAGDVEGWAWGAGTVAQGAHPALRTFAEICAPPTATPTPSPTATMPPPPTDTPTPPPTPTPWPTATWTPSATWTSTPIAAPVETLPTAGATLTPPPTAPPAATPTQPPTPTVQPPAQVDAPTAPVAATPLDAWVTDGQPTPLPSAGRRTFLPHLMRSAPEAAAAALPAAVAPPTALAKLKATPTALAIAMAPSTATDSSALTVVDRRATAPEMRRRQPAAVDRAMITRGKADPIFTALLALAMATAIAGARGRRHGGWRNAWPRPVARSRQPLRRRGNQAHQRWAMPATLIYGLSIGLGLVALFYPFLQTAVAVRAPGAERAADAPLLMMTLVGICFLALLSEVQEHTVSAKTVALLGVLVAINSVLRFVEVAIPGPGGFTPVFFLIVLTGYVYGARFGFLMGALTLLVSAVITGGVGPWLPGQMFTAGWMGLSAPLARPLVRLVGGRPGSRRELLMLAGFAGLWGLIYGVIINLWFWPFMAGPPDQYYQAGLSWGDVLRRYALFYLVTSLVWDLMAVVGNVALVLAFGAPTLRALRRFQQRFEFTYRPWAAQIKA